jgi:hypothetical protein
MILVKRIASEFVKKFNWALGIITMFTAVY